MPKRKTAEVKFPENWDISTEFRVDSETVLQVGDECQIKGDRGSYRFIKYVIDTEISNHSGWVTVFGGAANYGSYRSVRPDQIKVKKKKGKRTRKAQSDLD